MVVRVWLRVCGCSGLGAYTLLSPPSLCEGLLPCPCPCQALVWNTVDAALVKVFLADTVGSRSEATARPADPSPEAAARTLPNIPYVDVAWWSDDRLVLSTSTGRVNVCSITSSRCGLAVVAPMSCPLRCA